MKAKTVWKTVDDDVLYWRSLNGRIWFNDDADIRWVNCYGYENGVVSLKKGRSKILGDE